MRRISAQTWNLVGWLFGVGTPLLCIALDPALFRSDELDPAWFPSIAIFFYAAVLVSIAALGIALTRTCTPHFFRGIIFFGALLASGMSLLLTPFAVLLLGSGVIALASGDIEPFLLLAPLGFTPLATAVVFWRYFLRADKPETVSASLASLAGTAFAFLLPAGINIAAAVAVSSCLERVVATPGDASASDIGCLQRWAFTTDFSPFVRAYWHATPAGQTDLQAVYRTITGRDLERDAVLAD